jgi:predicted DNA binding protein
MAIIAEFGLYSSRLMLHQTFQTVPEVELDVVREVATDPNRPVVFFWAAGHVDAFEAAMDDDETVDSYYCYDETEDAVLYRVQASPATELVVYPVWVDLDVEPLEVGYADGTWHARMRFPGHSALKQFQTWCDEHDVEFDLHAVYTGTERSEYDLTDEQREALRLALEAGFFEIPRDVSMDDLAEELGVSRQAVSERLRRGHEAIIRQYVDEPLERRVD